MKEVLICSYKGWMYHSIYDVIFFKRPFLFLFNTTSVKFPYWLIFVSAFIYNDEYIGSTLHIKRNHSSDHETEEAISVCCTSWRKYVKWRNPFLQAEKRNSGTYIRVHGLPTVVLITSIKSHVPSYFKSLSSFPSISIKVLASFTNPSKANNSLLKRSEGVIHILSK